ncbi:MAG: RnfABCDGE type electron transport complex subunit G [Thermodesulfobacteriota bacterium]|nr:RnfABCDGE type electron transport complex subunit G [Thermodesulfobacteriota bacterium]
MREIFKMVVVLSAICLVAGLLLGTVKQATLSRIEEQVLIYVQGPALKNVLKNFDNNPIADRQQFDVGKTDTRVTVFPAISKGCLTGVAIEGFGKGYGGDIGVMVGFDLKKDQLTGIKITTMKETPGIGTCIGKDDFTAQFFGHPLSNLALKSQKGNIDAVSGATFSSKGAVDAVQKSANIYTTIKPEILMSWKHMKKGRSK